MSPPRDASRHKDHVSNVCGPCACLGFLNYAAALRSDAGSTTAPYTYVRGAGINVIDIGADPSVAYFADEVYQAGTAGLQGDLLDVARIEVLKGPQGTLFGRNAAAGAVSIIIKRPEKEFNFVEHFGDLGGGVLIQEQNEVTGRTGTITTAARSPERRAMRSLKPAD